MARYTHTDIDLTLRSEISQAISQSQNDTNLTDIETEVNKIGNALEAASIYGEMYQTDNAVATSIAVADTWYPVVNFTEGHTGGLTFASSLFTLTAGDWIVWAAISFAGGSNTNVQFTIGVDGTADEKHQVERRLSSSDVGAMALCGIVEATEGQTLGLQVKNITSTAGVTVEQCTFMCRKVHA